MFKNIDKKILILAGLIIVLPIFTMLLLVTLQSCTNRGNSYESYQRLMAKSADRYLKKNNLDDWTYNKSLQKICESLRVSKETKKVIKAMKR